MKTGKKDVLPRWKTISERTGKDGVVPCSYLHKSLSEYTKVADVENTVYIKTL